MIHEMVVERVHDGWSMELDIEVSYDLHLATKGARDGPGGPPLEPDEPAHIEINQAWDSETGHEVCLTDAERERAKQEIVIDLESMAEHQNEIRAEHYE